MLFTKHHGLGNDFLVALDLEARYDVDGELARRLCERRLGIGADGLIHATAGAGPADLTMTLFNADGTLAEMSGNGIRCLAQAEAMRRDEAELALDILTDAGLRHVEVHPGPEPLTVLATVDMGSAKGEPEQDGDGMLVDLGNSHLVRRVDDPAAVELPDADPELNVEFVAPGPEKDSLTMRVVERGVGETLACGTGACAAAYAAREWRIVGDHVIVHMPGGSVEVELGDTVLLTGPATYVAAVRL
jgi:diaminopimelate epimerase